MAAGERVLRNEDVSEIVAEIPTGHRHLRTTITLSDGSSFTLQEATMAALVRAYVSIKTDPQRRRIRLIGRSLPVRKREYAEWQLLEES